MSLFFTPRISTDTAPFWEGCREHRLLIQKCSCCGKFRWPAAYLCPDCLSEMAEWVPVSGRGTLYSYIVMHKAFHPTLADKVPYTVAEIDLEEGVRLVSNLVSDGRKPHCGDAVEVEWCDGEEYSKPEFHIV